MATDITTRTYTTGADPTTHAVLRRKFKALVKFCEANNIPAPTLTKEPIQESHTDSTGETWYEDRTRWTYTETAPIAISGWTVIAAIDPDPEGTGKAIVRSRGETDPSWADTPAKSKCDHCNSTRIRRTYIVIEHAEEGTKTIGANCAAKYIGVSLNAALAWWSYADEDEDASGNSGNGPRLVATIDYVTAAAAAILLDGYRKSGWEAPTKAAAWGLMRPGLLRGEGRAAWESVADEARDLAAASLEWAATLGGSSFEDNLRTVASREGLDLRHAGFAAYLPEAYRRHLADEEEAKAKAEADVAGSDWFGEVKERLNVAATVLRVTYIEGAYGSCDLVIAVTDGGDVVKWWNSGSVVLEVGDVVEGKATVKGHETYQGVRQTVVTRWSVAVVESPNISC